MAKVIFVTYTRFFKDLSKKDVALAGGKGASLGEMTRAGIPVPNGFVILSESFEKFLEATDLNVELDAILDSVNHKEMQSIENASEKIKALILRAQMPKEIETQITKDFNTLGATYVAVRSSATSEDSASAAWAGQLDSFLNTTEKDLLENVKRCWASLFTPRAIFYRFEKGLHDTSISVAVVVQKMVDSEISGIAFSVHPVTQDRNQLIIEAAYGLGEAIVSGQITPDSYVVEKTPRRIIDKNISAQEKGLFKVEGGGNEWKQTPNGEQQKLTDKQIEELSEIILRIEKHYGFPCDIEWAFEKKQFFIVQSRPITTLNPTLDSETNTKTVPQKIQTIQDLLSFIATVPLDIKQAKCSVTIAELVFNTYAKKDVLGKAYTPLIIPFKEGNLQQVIVVEQMNGFERNIWQTAIKNKKNFVKLLAKANALQKKIDAQSVTAIALTAMTDAELHHYFNEILTPSFAWWEYAKIGEEKGLIVDEKILPSLKRNHALTDEEAREYASDMSMPKGQSVFAKERILFLTLCIALLKNKKLYTLVKAGKPISASAYPAFTKMLQHYCNSYFYSRTNFYEAVVITKETLPQIILAETTKTTLAKIEEELKHIQQAEKELHMRQNKWSKRISLTKEEKDYFWYFTLMHTWIDDRKVSMSKHFYYLLSALKELGKRRKIPYQTMALLTHEELTELFAKNAKPTTAIEQRHQGVVFVYQMDTPRIEFNGAEAHAILQQLDATTNTATIKGTIACKGNGKPVQGNVRIVHDPAKDTFEEGEILVTTMTRPEFVPIMKKAKAIITDEGGLTSHAAIVSRELGVPCIIGTKNATRILKNGDMVEVEANKGKITITKKKTDIEITHIFEPLFNKEKEIQQVPGYLLGIACAAESTKIMQEEIGCSYSGFLFQYEKDSLDMCYFTEDLQAVAKELLNRYKKDKKFFTNQWSAHKKRFNQALSAFEAKKKAYQKDPSREKLFTLFDEVLALPAESVGVGHIIESISITQTHPLKDKLAAKIKDSKELTNALNILTTPEQTSFLTKYQLALKNYATLKDSKRKKQALVDVLEKYFWIQNGYAGRIPLSEKDVVAQAKQARTVSAPNAKTIRHKKEVLIKKYQLDAATVELAQLLSLLAIWQDERKEMILRSIDALGEIITLVSKATDFSEKQLMLLTSEEVRSRKYLDKGFIGSLKDREIYTLAIYQTTNTPAYTVLAGSGHKETIEPLISRKKQNDIYSLNGTCASTGKALGKVRICKNLADISNFPAGFVLVASMTRPEYLPAMKKAIAIITDEGGLTSHAAIVARELGVPCIIGTKTATKTLVNDDLVEVKANHGQVVIHSHAQEQISPTQIKVVADKVSGIESSLFMLSIIGELIRYHDVTQPYKFHWYGLTLHLDSNKADEWTQEELYNTEAMKILSEYQSKSKKYVSQLKKRITKEAPLLRTLSRQLCMSLPKLSEKQLIEKYKAYAQRNIEAYVLGTVTFIYERALSEELEKSISKRYPNTGDILGRLIANNHTSFIIKSEQALYQIKLQKNTTKKKKLIQKYLNDFYYTKANYFAAPKLTESEVATLALHAHKPVSQKQKPFSISLTKKEQRIVALLQEATAIRDIRKEINLIGSYTLERFLEEVTRRKHIPTPLAKKAFWHEYPLFFTDKAFVMRLQQRQDATILFQSNHIEYLEYIAIEAKQQHQNINMLRGTPASKGIVRGLVHIVHVSKEFDSFKEGEILVTENTRPDFIHLMKKSAAIITIEGGLTSHAAIVSRELKKPCIVGVKGAVQLLKTGMLIEVDANKGLVKILEKN